MENGERETEGEEGERGSDWTRFREGSAIVLLQSPKPVSDASKSDQLGPSVFFNPLQKLQRDLSVAVARQFFASQHADLRTTTAKEVECVKNQQQVQQRPTQQQQQQQQQLRVLDAFAGTGIRALRYLQELKGDVQVVASDVSVAAVESIRASAAILPSEKLRRNLKVEHVNFLDPNTTTTKGSMTLDDDTSVNCQGSASTAATGLLELHAEHCTDDDARQFDFVDLDPCGSAAPYIRRGLEVTKHNGLLGIAFTNMGELSGRRRRRQRLWTVHVPETQTRRAIIIGQDDDFCVNVPVDFFSLHEDPHHVGREFGVRLAVGMVVATAAAVPGCHVEVVCAYALEFYVRIFVKVMHTPVQAGGISCDCNGLQNSEDVPAGSPLLQHLDLVHTCECGSFNFLKPCRILRLLGKANPKVRSCINCQRLLPEAETERQGHSPTRRLPGPIYTGPLSKEGFLRSVVEAEQRLQGLSETTKTAAAAAAAAATTTTTPRHIGLLEMLAAERAATSRGVAPLFFSLRTCQHLAMQEFRSGGRHHSSSIPLECMKSKIFCSQAALMEKLAELGFAVGKSHVDAVAVKTNAPMSVIVALLQRKVVSGESNFASTSGHSLGRTVASAPSACLEATCTSNRDGGAQDDMTSSDEARRHTDTRQRSKQPLCRNFAAHSCKHGFWCQRLHQTQNALDPQNQKGSSSVDLFELYTPRCSHCKSRSLPASAHVSVRPAASESTECSATVVSSMKSLRTAAWRQVLSHKFLHGSPLPPKSAVMTSGGRDRFECRSGTNLAATLATIVKTSRIIARAGYHDIQLQSENVTVEGGLCLSGGVRVVLRPPPPTRPKPEVHQVVVVLNLPPKKKANADSKLRQQPPPSSIPKKKARKAGTTHDDDASGESTGPRGANSRTAAPALNRRQRRQQARAVAAANAKTTIGGGAMKGKPSSKSSEDAQAKDRTGEQMKPKVSCGPTTTADSGYNSAERRCCPVPPSNHGGDGNATKQMSASSAAVSVSGGSIVRLQRLWLWGHSNEPPSWSGVQQSCVGNASGVVSSLSLQALLTSNRRWESNAAAEKISRKTRPSDQDSHGGSSKFGVGVRVSGRGTVCVLEHCTISGFRNGGIVVCDGAVAVLIGCRILRNGARGVLVAGKGTTAFVSGGTCIALTQRGCGLEVRSAAIADVRESCIASNRTAGVYCHSNAQVFLNVPLSLPLLHGIPHSAKYDKELERRQHGTNEQQLSESSPLVKQLSGLTQTKTTWLVGNGGAGLECKRYSHAVIESSRLCHNAGGGLLVLDNGNVDVRNSLISCNRKAGIDCRDGAQCSAHHCDISGGQASGVFISQGGVVQLLRSCTVELNRTGIEVVRSSGSGSGDPEEVADFEELRQAGSNTIRSNRQNFLSRQR